MKKIIALILTIALCGTMLIGCNGETTQTDMNTGYQYEPQKEFDTLEIGEIKTKLVPDETATGTLTISNFGTDLSKDTVKQRSFNQALELYKKLYPNVEVTYDYESVGMFNNVNLYLSQLEDFAKKTQTEFMAGKGADVVFLQGCDVFKMMKAGAFADMAPYFEADENFCADEYNKAVLYGGQPAGKQYIVPLGYFFDNVLTTKENLEQTGYKIDENDTYVEQVNKFDKVVKKLDPERIGRTFNYFIFPRTFEKSFVTYQDVFDETIDFDNEANREYFEANARIFYPFINEVNTSESLSENIAVALTKDEYEFMDCSFTPFCMSQMGSFLRYNKQQPVVIPIKNPNGDMDASSVEIMAVNRGSKNKQNAYNFMKVMMSHEIQFSAEFMEENWDSPNATVPISIVATKNELKYRQVERELDYKICVENYGALTDEDVLHFLNVLQTIEYVEYNSKGKDIVKEELTPFMYGEKTLDECMKNAQDKLEIYVSE